MAALVCSIVALVGSCCRNSNSSCLVGAHILTGDRLTACVRGDCYCIHRAPSQERRAAQTPCSAVHVARTAVFLGRDFEDSTAALVVFPPLISSVQPQLKRGPGNDSVIADGDLICCWLHTEIASLIVDRVCTSTAAAAARLGMPAASDVENSGDYFEVKQGSSELRKLSFTVEDGELDVFVCFRDRCSRNCITVLSPSVYKSTKYL